MFCFKLAEWLHWQIACISVSQKYTFDNCILNNELHGYQSSKQTSHLGYLEHSLVYRFMLFYDKF